jgi:hypothetical protein
MEKKFQDLPDWTFWIDEVSAGVYNLKARHERLGCSIDLSGVKPEELLGQAKESARSMEHQIKKTTGNHDQARR